jgi:hypothetical protein
MIVELSSEQMRALKTNGVDHDSSSEDEEDDQDLEDMDTRY